MIIYIYIFIAIDHPLKQMLPNSMKIPVSKLRLSSTCIGEGEL